MLIAQISDTHIQMPGGHLDRDYDTAGHLARAVAHLNALDPVPDLVLLTGDTVDAGGADEYDRLRDLLSELSMPVFAIPGNHDERGAMRAAFAKDGYLPDEGFLHYAIEDWPLRLIGLDTQVTGESGGWLCPERLAWLDACLADEPERPTLVFQHHPPFVTGLKMMDSMGLRNGDELAAVLSRHPQVQHLVCGHVHRPVSTAFGGTVASACPSTAHQIRLALAPREGLATVMEPPAAALLWWNEDAGQLIHHLSYVGERPAHVLHDGEDWRPQPLPPGFRD